MPFGKLAGSLSEGTGYWNRLSTRAGQAGVAEAGVVSLAGGGTEEYLGVWVESFTREAWFLLARATGTGVEVVDACEAGAGVDASGEGTLGWLGGCVAAAAVVVGENTVLVAGVAARSRKECFLFLLAEVVYEMENSG